MPAGGTALEGEPKATCGGSPLAVSYIEYTTLDG
jgi:hypothetical protein